MDDQALRVALVTGGASGLGKAAAIELVRLGWSVFIQHSASVSADEALSDIRALADETDAEIEVAATAADLTASADREQLIEQVLANFGQIDMLVNAAPGRGGPAADLLEVTEQAYRQIIDTGVTATFLLTQLVANEMVRLVEAGQIESPKIVTINSIGAYTTSGDYGPQCISRAALAMITRLFADRLGEHGIKVYEVCVGIITTGAGDIAHERYDKLITEGLTPIRRWGRPGDVARAVAAIAEDFLSFSTGEVINVDGGFHLRRL